ncbi:hypothetical protein QBC34DRAFT_401903 [Podospora aff. communis PSN243]|uniref:F-box domain-containing protein n=1 Tax=Podospora aff. communis PSN243 TaxID=3040156 RepID=A0AAV9GSJ5_9PEZI|nr:hypothetical protein QBC34DRAFT_401903 [Podospora aff. communis PSN243]
MDAPKKSDALSLEALPAEILTAILETLIPQPPEIGETRPVTYHKLMPDEPWYDFTRCRRGLWSLCLVSRCLRASAQPLLYRVMALLDDESMFLFFRTLVERPLHGRWTRYLGVHLTLTRDSCIRETRRAIGRLLRAFQPATEPPQLMGPIIQALQVMSISLPALSTLDGDFDDVPQVIVAFMLMFLTRLETLLLQVPICDDHPEYAALFLKLQNARRHFAHAAEGEQELIPFQRIETLLLQGDPELLDHFENEECDCEIPEVWGSQARRYYPLFACFPRLHTLEVSTDDGAWSNIMDERTSYLTGETTSTPYLAGIRHLYIHNSVACPRNLHHVLLNAPDLETLYMTPRRDDDFYRGPPESTTNAHPQALDIALTSHARHLRHLDVGWYDVSGFESLIGAEGRLASLCELPRLEKLCIQLAALYGTSPATALQTPLAELLPPNLIELTLEDWWWSNTQTLDHMEDWGPREKLTHYRNQREYRRLAIQMLEQFARDFDDRMTKLKKVMLLVKIPFTWVVEDGIDIGFHFEQVKRLFGERGVEFCVEASDGFELGEEEVTVEEGDS